MCCLFGILDYGTALSGQVKARMLSILAKECEARGTDATGIAYVNGGRLRIYKRPLPAHKMRFFLPNDVRAVMGHTRLTTQGSEKRNFNNHPFAGRCGGLSFALAHNGVLCNDSSLRREWKLPKTTIETDSYVAVQLLQTKGTLGFSALGEMAEAVEGSFSFTVLDRDNHLYFIMTGTRKDRPELTKLLDRMTEGDTVVIESLSRLGRSTKDLIELVELFEARGVHLVSLKESIDTSSSTGKLLFTLMSAIAQ